MYFMHYVKNKPAPKCTACELGIPTRQQTMSRRETMEHDLYMRVVSMDAESAKAFVGTDQEPVDLGPPARPERYRDGARVWGFPRPPRNADERAAVAWGVTSTTPKR